MLFTKKTLSDIDLKDKQIVLRVDYNVPLRDQDGRQVVADDYRIRMSLPTIKALLEQRCSIVILSHLGRPRGKVVPELSLRPAVERLGQLLEQEVKFVDNCVSDEATKAAESLEPGQIVVLENTRFHYQEEADEQEFAKQLASYGEVFVQDCFGVVHREHASIHAVAKFLPAVAGLLVEREVRQITKATTHPKRPLVLVVGGAKIQTKIALLEHLIPKTQKLIIGGAMANTFLKAQGYQVGKSLVDDSEIPTAKRVLAMCNESAVELLLPTADVAVADDVSPEAARRETLSSAVGPEEIILDIGQHSIDEFCKAIEGAGTIIWNGPVGMSEFNEFRHGTEAIAKKIVEGDSFSIVGGGDTAEFVASMDMMDQFSHVSTGGGSSLELMSGKSLPGIEALLDK